MRVTHTSTTAVPRVARSCALAGALALTAALSVACAGETSPEKSGASSASGVRTTRTSESTSTTEAVSSSAGTRPAAAPQVREGGVPRIGQLCPNRAGDVRKGANGQALKCSVVGNNEVWTVVPESSDRHQAVESQTWIPTTAESTTGMPSETSTQNSETPDSTTSETTSPTGSTSTETDVDPGTTRTEAPEIDAPGMHDDMHSEPSAEPSQDKR